MLLSKETKSSLNCAPIVRQIYWLKEAFLSKQYFTLLRIVTIRTY